MLSRNMQEFLGYNKRKAQRAAAFFGAGFLGDRLTGGSLARKLSEYNTLRNLIGPELEKISAPMMNRGFQELPFKSPKWYAAKGALLGALIGKARLKLTSREFGEEEKEKFIERFSKMRNSASKIVGDGEGNIVTDFLKRHFF